MEAKMDLEYIEDLIGDIKRIDALILLHRSHSDSFMCEQWSRRKLKVMKELAEELTRSVDSDTNSVVNFIILRNLLNKYYSNEQGIQKDSIEGQLLAAI